jgi:hypothetical protein
MPVQPVRTTPQTAPTTEPMRRLEPERLCPNQKERVTRRIERELG